MSVGTGTSALGADAVLDALEDRTLPPARFDHRAHVRAAWECLRREPSLGRALERFARALSAYAAAQGATGKYHETLTVAFVLLIHDRLRRSGPVPWDTFVAANPDLLLWPNPVLARWYSRETLGSEVARRSFVLPDALAEPARQPRLEAARPTG
ncbi:MAG TPA: hypothetical protein VF530_22450 [Planctomycetota bacterium]